MNSQHNIARSGSHFGKQEIETSISARFERQVEKYPAHPAVKTKTKTLSYSELNQASNKIARFICATGGESAETVGLMLNTGIDMIIAILSVLKAGKTWVALDPGHPADRTSFILEDSGAKIILTNDENMSIAARSVPKDDLLINMDAIDPTLSGDNLNIPVSSHSFANIIYTSGSSGRPKGVIHTHRLQLHNIWLHTNSFGIDADDRVSLLSSFGFLAGITAMLRALLNGACLLPFSIKNEGILKLRDWLGDEGITIYQSVPTVFRQLMSTLSPDEKFPKMRIVHLGGEAVHRKDVELYQRHFGAQCLLVSNYGSSETATLSQYFIGPETKLEKEVVPVGFPVEDKEILILDSEGGNAAKGQIGEIAVKSAFLAEGYWRNAEMTSQRFILDPLQKDVRIFKTGDMGYIGPNAGLVITGRKDNQVKIGGQRLELSEIENVLLAHPQLKSCAVAIQQGTTSESYLAAYLEAKNQERPSITSLRSHLKQKLPDFMIPSKFVFLRSMPLLPNGKIDRRSLPAPDRVRPELATAYVAPQNVVEKRVAEIWRELLGIDEIGINDDFFDLGGQSLSATQLASRINEQFKIAIPLRFIFEMPTVKEISALIEILVTSRPTQMEIRNLEVEERERFTL
jgi:amino acid adenylation domain-containing protein